MSRFGELLSFYRRQSSDRERGGKLTQERLGDLLGRELEGGGYTGAAISEWERGKSHIHKDHRKVLVALIKVLYQNGGMKSMIEADTFLLSSNYRPLDDDEKKCVFTNDAPRQGSAPGINLATALISAQQWLTNISDLMKEYIDEHEPQISHRGSRLFLGSLGFFFSQWSFRNAIRWLFWLGLLVAAQKTLFPLLHWPFTDQSQAWKSLVWYLGGVLTLPAVVALLTSTDRDTFWSQQNQAGKPILRLYTYTGAFMGFNIGYLMVFVVTLVGYYLGIKAAPAWLAILGAAWPLVVGYSAARQVPFNHWRAYGDLRLSDGAPVFLAAGIAFGPIIGFFLYTYHVWLLEPLTGIALFTLSAVLLYGITIWHNKRGHMVVQPHVWVLLWGSVVVSYAALQGAGIFWLVALATLLIVIAVLLARQQLHFNLPDMAVYLVGLIALLVSLRLHSWVGVACVFLAVAAWRWCQWEKQDRFPFSLWFFIVVVGIGASFLREGMLNPPWASLLVGLAACIIILWTVRNDA